MATKAQIQNFIDTLGPIVRKVVKELGYGNAQIQTCIAQACCESAYGTASIMTKANAVFGIKADKGWVNAGHKFYKAGTKECYDGKNYVGIVDGFRAYDSIEEGIRDYFKLLSYPRYNKCLTKTTVKDCITEIKNGGYATSPTYINTIVSIYNANANRINKYLLEAVVEEPKTETVKPVETPKTNNTDELVLNIIRGFYGNGAARRKKLEAEGYNYQEIQRLVNIKMEELVVDTINGKYGNGKERKIKLGDLYPAVQYEVNKRFK